MQLAANIFDVWAFRRSQGRTEFLLLRTSQEKADRYFNGGRFWQIPSGQVLDGESVTEAIRRKLEQFGLRANAIWAAEHAYTVYNRRFENMQLIGVYAAEVDDAPVALAPVEHSEYGWCDADTALELVHYRGLKEGLKSVREYVTGVGQPAAELCLFRGDLGD